MQISVLNLKRLHNEEHFQFQTEFRDLINETTSATLGIETQYASYLQLYSNESEALNFIRKSDITNQLAKCDALSNTTFRGLAYLMKSSEIHYIPTIKEAAARVQPVFSEYGNIAIKSATKKTAAINNLVSRLNQDYAADISTLGIGGWLNELKANNTAFDTLMKSRNSQESAKTKLRMGKVRIEVDAAYKQITDRINALIIVNGAAVYTTFVDQLNQWIETYNNSLAIRSGKKSKDNPPPASEN